MEETCKEDFLQWQPEARGDIPWLRGASTNSTGDSLSNGKTCISTRSPGSPLIIRNLSVPLHKQTSQFSWPNPTPFSTDLKELCLLTISEKNGCFCLLNPWKAVVPVFSRLGPEVWSCWKGSPTCAKFSCCQGSASQVENFPHTPDGKSTASDKRQC